MEQGKGRSRVMRVMDRVVDGIVNGTYPDDALPPQDLLAKQLNVSRSVVREAVSILTSRRMLVVRPKAGTHVRPLNDWQMIDREVVQWRTRTDSDPGFLCDLAGFSALVVPLAAAQAALHASARERVDICAARDALLLADDRKAYRETEEALHTAIMKASGNQILRQMAVLVCASLSTTTGLSSKTALTLSERKTLGRLVDSINAGDADGAEAATAMLIELTNGEVSQMESRIEQPVVVG